MTKEWATAWSWSGTPTNPGHVSLSVGQFFHDWIISPSAAMQEFDEPTVLRMIVGTYVAGEPMTPSQQLWLDVGIIVTRSADPALETLPQLDPLLDGHMDWLYTAYHFAQTPPGFGGNTSGNSPFTANVKSRRKIGPGEGLALFAFNRPSSSDVGLDVTFTIRTLFAHA